MSRRTRGFPPTRPLARRIACPISMGHYQRDLVSATDRLLEDLPFRRISEQMNRSFPQLVDRIWIVVDADTPEPAEATGGWQAWVSS